MPSSHKRRLMAASFAYRLLSELGVNQTRQVDVFGLIERLGVWLGFFSLKGLLGAYLPEGTGGILVTTERSMPIQRYTAAHELGHWCLNGGHAVAFDSEADVLGRSDIESETLAQAFAGALLMPPPLVDNTLSRRNATSLIPQDIYAVSREAGVSYEAAARQLCHLERITQDELRGLLKEQPIEIKKTIGAGRRPIIGNADVWPVDLAWRNQQLKVRAEDEIIVSLPEDRSTGYRWSIPGTGSNPRRITAQPPPPFAQPPPPSAPDEGESQTKFAMTKPTMEARRKPPRLAIQRALQPAPKEKQESLTILGGRATLVGDTYIAIGTSETLTDDAIRSRRLAMLGASEGRHPVEQVDKEKVVVGAMGRRIFGIRLEEPGKIEFRMVLRDEYSDADPVDEFRITAAVEARREKITIDQLSDGDKYWADLARHYPPFEATAKAKHKSR